MAADILEFLKPDEQAALMRQDPKPQADPEEKKAKPSQTDILLNIIESCQLFHDELQEPYARIAVRNHYEVWPVRSTTFKRWLIGRFYILTNKGCNSDAVNQALNVADAKALFDGARIPLSLRCAERDGAFWYDLANERWQTVKIVADGWEVVNSPILFRRFANTAAQVIPARNGDIYALRHFVNLKNDDEFNLLLVYIISCLVPNVPKVVLPLSGEKGASKSTMLRMLRQLIDPAQKELQTLPNDQKELPLTLYKNYMPAFDNLSTLHEWQSDALCCAATGGGISKRKLYTDDEEVILSFLRCVTLDGINTVATKPDLLDRSISFELERISQENRKTERQFWADFKKSKPVIVGGMFDILSHAMAIYPKVKLDNLPRMADFCQWGYAIAEAMGWGGNRFLQAYYSNIGRANDEAIRNSPVAAAVMALMREQGFWQGSSAQLLRGITDIAHSEQIDTFSKSWPKSAEALTKRLKHYKSNFLDAGFECLTERDGHTKKTTITFQQVTEKSSACSAGFAKPDNTSLFDAERVRSDEEICGALKNVDPQEEPSDDKDLRIGGACGANIPTFLDEVI